MRADRDELQNIVERADLPDAWKDILKEAFRSLGGRYDSVLKEIREHAERESHNLQADWSKRWNVVTALAEAGSKLSGFCDIVSFSEADSGEELLNECPTYIDIEGSYFLDCSYEQAESICSFENTDKYPYRGCIEIDGGNIEFHYRLARDWRYIEEERLLFDIADIYHITKPVVFSPYSRRAVKIQLPIQDSDAAELLRDAADLTPYLLEENSLKDKLLADRQLLWNIRIGEVKLPEYNPSGEGDCGFVAPYGDREIYRYEFNKQKNGDFICPDTIEIPCLLAAEKDEERQLITLITNRKLKNKCRSLSILRPKEYEEQIAGHKSGNREIFFSNVSRLGDDRAGRIFAKERLRTQGDIERLLHCFNIPEYDCKFAGVSDSRKTELKSIKRYSGELSYGACCYSCREQLLYGKRRVLPCCHIRFSGRAKFLADYADYVLFFLENRYPDFLWAGVM